MLSASLEVGVDCPEGATYVEATTFFQMDVGGTATADPTEAFVFYPTCVFEFTEDHTIWRHMENDGPRSAVRGLERRTLVVRSIATVGNYDYITDYKFREDGEIEVSVRFAGYIEARHFFGAGANAKDGGERAYSSILRPDLAGPVHSHSAVFKVDLDVGGDPASARL